MIRPGVWCLSFFWLGLILLSRVRPARLVSYTHLYTPLVTELQPVFYRKKTYTSRPK